VTGEVVWTNIGFGLDDTAGEFTAIQSPDEYLAYEIGRNVQGLAGVEGAGQLSGHKKEDRIISGRRKTDRFSYAVK